MLRLPWEFTVRGAIDRAGRLASGRPAGRFRRSTPRASCPLCRVVAALRCLYARAADDGLISEADNPARKVAKPRRLPTTRRALPDTRLTQINQIGTVTETLQAMAICRDAGYRQFVSHRSGETEASFIADLTVGTGSGHLKSGAPARGERVAKYNRLIEIAASSPAIPYGMP